MGGGVGEVDDVGSNGEVEGRPERGEVGGDEPVELGELWGAGEDGAVPAKIAAEGGEDGGDVCKDNVDAKADETEPSEAVAGAELDVTLLGEAKKVGVGI